MARRADGSQVVDLVGAVLAQGRNVVDLEFGTELLAAESTCAPLLLLDGLAHVVGEFQTTTDAESVQHPEGVHRLVRKCIFRVLGRLSSVSLKVLSCDLNKQQVLQIVSWSFSHD